MAVVAIVGRPNVGKSTLFNRLAGKRLAIVERQPGVTRDRVYSEVEWGGRRFILVDTGGIGLEEGFDERLESAVRRQTEIAVREAHLILFVVDAREGVTSTDMEVANWLRRTGKPVLVVGNKADDPSSWARRDAQLHELGLGEPSAVSAEHGLGIGDLLDLICSRLPYDDSSKKSDPKEGVSVAVVGRPNVGKSSLVNALARKERVVVGCTPGTTRDAVDVTLKLPDGRSLTLVDTAGLRRKARVDTDLERKSVISALLAIQKSDVVLLVLDLTLGVTEQDKRLAGFTQEAGKGLILVGNKLDLVRERPREELVKDMTSKLYFVDYAPCHLISALNNEGVSGLHKLILEVGFNRTMAVQRDVLQRVVSDAVAMMPPPARKGIRRRDMPIESARQVRCFQASGPPPTFVLQIPSGALTPSYARYLAGRIREVFGFRGNPIRIVAKRPHKRTPGR